MKDTETKLSFAARSTRVLYQFSLATGTLLISYAVFLLAGGTIEAILMFLPGLLAFGGGLVIRKATRSLFA